MPMLITWVNSAAWAATALSRPIWLNSKAQALVAAQAIRPTPAPFHSDCRTEWPMASKRPAPTSWATTVLMAIMIPITVTSTIDHTEAPSDTAASWSALT